jgi:flavin-dependent dehydrogenase
MFNYDVVIVGGSWAGLQLARNLIGTGIKIAVVERNKNETMTFLGAMIDGTFAKEFKRYYFNTPNKSQLISIDHDYNVREGFVIEKEVVLLDEDQLRKDIRKELQKAKNIDLYFNTAVVSINDNGAYVDIKTNNKTFRSKVVVGADGCNSIVAKELDFDSINYQFLPSFRYVLENCKNIDSKLNLFILGPQIGLGYAWLYPRSKTSCNFGIGSVDKIKNMKVVLSKIKEKYPQLKNAKIKKVGGGMLPYLGLRRDIVKGRAMLFGNSAGQVNSILGGGVQSIYESAPFLADILIKSHESDFDMESLNAYNSFTKTPLNKELWRTGAVVKHAVGFCKENPNGMLRFIKLLNSLSPKYVREVCEGKRIARLPVIIKNLPLVLKITKYYIKYRIRSKLH